MLLCCLLCRGQLCASNVNPATGGPDPMVVIRPKAKVGGLPPGISKERRPLPPTGHALKRGEGFADWFRRFSSLWHLPAESQNQVFLGGCLILDNTPSTASIITDDADDAMIAGDAKQGAENCRKGVTGSERNGSERNCTKMKRGLERNQNAGKCKGRT